MQDAYIENASLELKQKGYVVARDPLIPGIQALLYAHSPRRFRLGFARVEDHFLFVDWGNSLFSRPEMLLEVYRRFSAFVNEGFKIPHALRMQIPNLALVVLSPEEFPREVIQSVRARNQTPWYGGETGQIILVDLNQKLVFYQTYRGSGRAPRPGDFPLTHAVDTVLEICPDGFTNHDKTRKMGKR